MADLEVAVDEKPVGISVNTAFGTRARALNVSLEDNPNMIVYIKMESIIEDMQKNMPIRTVKNFMTKIHSVFTGQDLISWLMNNICVDSSNSQMEASLLANRMSEAGYFFPIDDHFTVVKNDNTAYYRFQSPYYWPSKNLTPENNDYAVYLCKRTMQNKELADYEAENLARLQKMFSRKWEYIFLQAEEQVKLDKKREKNERKILDTQERAFWNVYRPQPGGVNITEFDIRKVCRVSQYESFTEPTNLRDCVVLKHRLREETNHLQVMLDKRTIRISKCSETLIEHYSMYREHDFFIVTYENSNPWLTDSSEVWEGEKCLRVVSERRVKRWSFSCWELLRDPIGRNHFLQFLEKEYATENLLFVEAVWRMKKLPQKDVSKECQNIWSIFLSPGAEVPVNVDSTSHKITDQNMANGSDRWTFDVAAAHLYYLMTSDSYSRYLRSPYYKNIFENSKKNTKPISRAFALPKLSSTSSSSLKNSNQTLIISSTNN